MVMLHFSLFWNTSTTTTTSTKILIKREPLVYTRAQGAVQKKKKKGLGQYDSINKLIHGQYTSRYNLHLSLSVPLPLSLSHTPPHSFAIHFQSS